MNPTIELALGFVRAAWRRRWLAIKIAWAVAAVAWVIVLLLPNKFQASAKVFVDPSTVLRPVLRGIAIEDEADAQIALVREALLSRPQLEAVARKTDLDRMADTPTKLDNLITGLQNKIIVESTSTRKIPGMPTKDNLYTITYQSPNRNETIAVVRALLDNFVEGTLSGNRSGSLEAQGFLEKQIKDYEKRLSDAEGRLAEFKKKNVGLIPGDKGDYFSRLDGERYGLQQSETQLAIAISRREELRRQLAKTQPYVAGTAGAASGGGGVSSDVSVRVLEAEARLEELLLRFTDKHPEVVELRRTIAELKERERRELADLNRGGRGSGAIRSLNANPVYQQVQQQLNQADVEIASLRGAVAQHQREIADLRRFVNTAPEVEQEFARLNRDYGVTKTQYETLVQRLEQARVADDAAQAGAVRFEVIEPPRADVNPVWPNRMLFILAGTLAGIVVGLGTVVVMHLLAPTFDSVQLLQSETGVPVLGSVSRVRLPEEDRMAAVDRRRLAYVGGSLVAASVVLVVLLQVGALNRLFA